MDKNHLMHPRVVHNHLDNGYFPTDEGTLSAIADRLDLAQAGSSIKIFDPCCGEGSALAYLAGHLAGCGAECIAYGVELERERAKAAQDRLNFVIQSDIENTKLQTGGVGLLFLNPPYGFEVKDQFSNQRAKRLEEVFFNRTVSCLQAGGVLAMVVPTQSLSEEFTYEIATRCTDIQIFRAAVDTYKQVVVMGTKPLRGKPIGMKLADAQQRLLLDYAHAMPADAPPAAVYQVPPAPDKTFRPLAFKLDPLVLAGELEQHRNQTLWPHFGQLFGGSIAPDKRPPLCTLGQWHAALALAAGQVNGIVTAADGRRLLVKGSTHKTKVVTVSEEYDSKDRLIVTTTATDRFVPRIKAVNLTESSPDFGCVLTIS